MGLTYSGIAEKIGIDWCPSPGGDTRMGGKCRSPEVNHLRGFADIGRSCVHWSDRKVQRSGMRRFLMMAASIHLRHNRGQPAWLQIYEQNVWATKVALTKLSKTMPGRLSAADRARVAWLLQRDKPAGNLNVKRWAYNRKKKERHGVH